MGYTIQWSILFEQPYREWIIQGIYHTFYISLISWVFALFIGIFVGMMSEAPVKGLQYFSTAYVQIFRNIPLLVQLFFSYFVIPLLLPLHLRRHLYEIGWELGSAIFTLSLYTSAKISEHVRAGLNAVDKEIRQCALSTGLTWWQVQVYVVVPLLLRIIVPSITTEFVTIFKSSSLAMAVGVTETTYVTQRIGFHSFRWIEASTMGTIVYLCTAWSIALIMGLIEKQLYVPGLIKRDSM